MENISEKASQLIDWYWNNGGRDRRSEFQLPLGSWVDKLYWVTENAEKLKTSVDQARGAVALWGASQTGKSTFLSRYIDAGADHTGYGTALDWGSPALFSGAGMNVLSDVTVFNPYNGGNDGSACITRFVMARMGDAGLDPQHPVQIRLFQPKQLLNALAFGFLSECQLEDDKKQVTYWDLAKIQALLSSVGESDAPASKEAYELLRDVADVLELLTHTKDPRYRNLSGVLVTLRQDILECSGLLASRDAVLTFAATLFWNGWSTLTKIFNELCDFRQWLARQAHDPNDPDLRISCTLKVASLVVDFSTYPNLLRGEDKVSDVFKLKVSRGGAGLVITEKTESGGGELLFARGQEKKFALLQALSWELVVPLREDVLLNRSRKLHELLTRADLLDIPGTANESEAAEPQLLTNEKIIAAGPGAEGVFTKIIKRGKTSALVLANARSYDIDAFSIFAKWGVFVGKQKQLDTGVGAWWASYLEQPFTEASSKDLPLNFVVTFFGRLASDMVCRGDRSTPGAEFTGFFGKVGPICSPKLVSSFATTYRHLPDGKIRDVDDRWPSVEKRTAAYERLLTIPEMCTQFIDGNWCLPGEKHNMSMWHCIVSEDEDSSTNYLMDKMIQDAVSSPRQRKVRERYNALLPAWRALVSQAMPDTGNDQVTKTRLLNEWRTALETKLETLKTMQPKENAAQKVSYHLRTFLHVEATDLKNIPINISRSDEPFDEKKYLQEQLARWKERIPERTDLDMLGFEDEAHALRMRGYLAEAVVDFEMARDVNDHQGVVGLLLGPLDNTNEKLASSRRSFLALALARALIGEPDRQPHRVITPDTLRDVVQAARKNRASRAFDYLTSAHYTSIVRPFLDFLQRAAAVPVTGRGVQPGDDYLIAHFSNL